jgi:lysophospholipase
MRCFALLALIFSSLGVASGSFMNREAHYEEFQNLVVKPFFDGAVFEKLKLRDGKNLAYRVFENEKSERVIVLLQGRTESMKKHAELMYDFFQLGYTVITFDYRGQGESDHLVPHHPTYGHIDDFDTYVEDLNELYSKVIGARREKSKFAYAHSMGGAVIALFDLKYPSKFEKIIWQSPMLSLKTGAFPNWLAKSIVGTMVFFGFGEHLPPLQGDFDENEINNVTTSVERRKFAFSVRKAERSSLIGPPTSQWVYGALQATRQIQDHAQSLSTPTLLLKAGNDHFVKNEDLDAICSKAKFCKSALFSEGMHELYLESDTIRTELLTKVNDFLSANF